MNNFKEFQFAAIIFVISIPIQVFITILFLIRAGNHPMTMTSFVAANSVFLIVYLLFYGMKTTIENERINITYGIGLIRKSIKLAEIKTVSVVSNPWYYGWGIRLIPNGMLYNINGSGGVELTFTNTSRVIRIGSANAASLKEAIQSLITT